MRAFIVDVPDGRTSDTKTCSVPPHMTFEHFHVPRAFHVLCLCLRRAARFPAAAKLLAARINVERGGSRLAPPQSRIEIALTNGSAACSACPTDQQRLTSGGPRRSDRVESRRGAPGTDRTSGPKLCSAVFPPLGFYLSSGACRLRSSGRHAPRRATQRAACASR